MKQKIYLQKNNNKKEDKHPDLIISIIKETNGETEFIKAGALWKSKSGKGYTGEFDSEAQPYSSNKQIDDGMTSRGYNGEEPINPNDIPFD